MGLDSRLIMKEEVTNKDRKFGSWGSYFPVKIELLDGMEIDALFTMDQLDIAMERANKNPEDMPKEHGSLFDWLFS